MKNHCVALLASFSLGLVFFAGCKKDQAQQLSAELGETKTAVAGLQWNVPKRWTLQPEKPMRAATYAVPATSAGVEGGDCAVFKQFEDGAKSSRTEKEVGGLKITRVEIDGTYLSPGGMMMESTGKKENYRLLGGIVNGPEGFVFFKFTGPKETVEASAGEFDAMLGSVTK
jgi:hypothetical protein